MKNIIVLTGIIIAAAFAQNELKAQTANEQKPANQETPPPPAPQELKVKAPKPPTPKTPEQQHITVPKVQPGPAKPVPPLNNGEFGLPGQPKKQD